MFWGIFYYKKHCQLGVKKKETRRNERMLLESQYFTGRKQAQTTQLQTHFAVQEKRSITPKAEPLGRRLESQTTEYYTQSLKSNGIFLAGFKICLRPVTPFGMRISITYTMPSCYGILETDVFYGFVDLQFERNFAQE